MTAFENAHPALAGALAAQGYETATQWPLAVGPSLARLVAQFS